MAGGSVEPIPDPLHRRDGRWPWWHPSAWAEEARDANEAEMDAATAFDLTFYHGIRST